MAPVAFHFFETQTRNPSFPLQQHRPTCDVVRDPPISALSASNEPIGSQHAPHSFEFRIIPHILHADCERLCAQGCDTYALYSTVRYLPLTRAGLEGNSFWFCGQVLMGEWHFTWPTITCTSTSSPAAATKRAGRFSAGREFPRNPTAVTGLRCRLSWALCISDSRKSVAKHKGLRRKGEYHACIRPLQAR